MRIVLIALIAVASPAYAGKTVKAQLLCGVFVDGKIKDVVPAKGKPRLDQPVACALHLSVENNDTFMGNIHTVRYVRDPATGKTSQVATIGETSDIENNPGLKKDVELVMKPGTKDGNGDIMFQPCEDFDVVAKVFDDRGVYFTKTIKVQQACPRPKAMKATAGCFALKDGGDRFDLPDKKKRSLDGYTVTCWAKSKDPRFPTAKLSGYTEYTRPTMDGSDGHTVHDPRSGKYEEGEDESASMLQLDSDDVPVCLPGSFDIKLFVDDASGAHLFTKKLTIQQKC